MLLHTFSVLIPLKKLFLKIRVCEICCLKLSKLAFKNIFLLNIIYLKAFGLQNFVLNSELSLILSIFSVL